MHKEKGLITTGSGEFLGVQLTGVFFIMAFTATLTVAFFFTVKRRFHLRLSKIEEVLGYDCQEDDLKMQLEIYRLVDDLSGTKRAQINLI
mmetsp:Transcript_12940/g.17430  ORF Transcript_12940/g.17430 Transcript_12940/m.17430 type:complete len:90 (+) Transcript_12940:1987-2256(+)